MVDTRAVLAADLGLEDGRAGNGRFPCEEGLAIVFLCDRDRRRLDRRDVAEGRARRTAHLQAVRRAGLRAAARCDADQSDILCLGEDRGCGYGDGLCRRKAALVKIGDVGGTYFLHSAG